VSDVRSGVAVGDVVAACLTEVGLSAVSAARVASSWARFTEFVEARGVLALGGVSPRLVEDFVQARLASGLVASVSTRRNRLWAVRLLFRLARKRGLVAGDPTMDVAVPRSVDGATRPLTDGEVERCREVAWWTSPRAAAVWGLAETTCRGAELSAVGVEDVELADGVVRLPGSSRVLARGGVLSVWGSGAVGRQLALVSEGCLVYSGSGSSNAGQVSTCRALGTVLLRAGLGGDRRVRPASIAGWAGRRVFEESGRVEDAARVLGVRSLDSAARMIGLDWVGDA
jgi:integrase/recombinase XerC